MKRFATILLAASAGVAIGTWAAAAWVAWQISAESTPGRDAGPRIVLSTTSCELGTVPADAPLTARFTIHNEGGRRLVVRRERGACCGPAAHDDLIIVKPGCSAKLTTTIDPAAELGRMEKIVTYRTNDPALPQFELAVSANVLPPILADGGGAPVD